MAANRTGSYLVTITATMEIGIKEAKNNLSSLMEQARGGTRTFVTNRGERMVELVPVADAQAPVASRGLGWLRDKSKLPKGFGTAKWKKSGTDAVLRDMGLS
jgi:prevent-host-death family protein